MDRQYYKDIYKRAYSLLENSTPLNTDCGRLCAKACCAPDDDMQGGMYLFPGEEYMHESAYEWAEITDADLCLPGGMCVKALNCAGRCDRALRPLACRIFPLTPAERGGELTVEMDRRAWAVCPLMEHGIKALRQEFVADVMRAMRIIYGDAACREYITQLTKWIDMYGLPL